MSIGIGLRFCTPLGVRILLALGLFAGLAQAARAQPYAVQMRPAIAYGPDVAEQGDLYAPVQPMGPLPTIVMMHGGGWVEGSRQFTNGFAKLIAGMGAVVFSIDYRLASEARPDTRWPAQLADAQLAVRFLRAHADEFGVNPARIGAVGDSAGGQLAIFLGLLHKTVPGDRATLYAAQHPDVQAVVDQFGPVDLAALGASVAQSTRAMFGTAEPSGSQLLTASPLPLIGGKSVPIYILHGTADQLIPFEQSRRLADALRSKGANPVLVPFDGGHEYAGVPVETIAKLRTDAARWILARLQ